jgi:hypothetical protein
MVTLALLTSALAATPDSWIVRAAPGTIGELPDGCRTARTGGPWRESRLRIGTTTTGARR